jgi:hypothetical protein
VKQADLKDRFKKASKSVCTSTILVSLDPLISYSINFQAMKTPENTEADPDEPEAADEGDIQMEYSSV